MVRMGWQRFSVEHEVTSLRDGFRVQEVEWTGPGWYWVSTREQKCPRG